MNFCHACGAKQSSATSFCTSCGTRLDRQEIPSGQPTAAYGSPEPRPVQAPSAPSAPVQAPSAPVQAGPAATAARATSMAMPSLDQVWQRYGGDWSRALISILLLILSLSLVWNDAGSSADNVPALLAIILALPIGVVDLLLRPAIVGRVFAANQLLLFRALLATPLVAVALWALIDNMAHGSGFGPGIGVALTGAAVGVTGAVTMSEPGQARMWLTAAAGSLVVSCLWLGWTAVQSIKEALNLRDVLGADFWAFEIAIVLMLIWNTLLAAWLAQLAFSGSPKTRPIAWWLAACLGVWLLLARVFTSAFNPVSSRSAIIGAITFLAVGVALLTSSSIRKAVLQPPAFGWMTAAYAGLLVLGTAHVVNLFTTGLTLSQLESAKGPYIWLLVLQMAGAAGAFVTRSALGRDPKTGRILVLIYTAAFTAAFWLTYLIADSVVVRSYSVDEAVLMVGPVAVALCLLVPPSVRQMLGPIGMPAAFQGMQVTPGAPVAPVTPSAPGHAPGGQFHGGHPASPGQPQAGGQG